MLTIYDTSMIAAVDMVQRLASGALGHALSSLSKQRSMTDELMLLCLRL